MNLQEALELRERIDREVTVARASKRNLRDEQIPDDPWVVTKDGDSFKVMYFTGDWDSYKESVIESAAAWDALRWPGKKRSHD